MRCLINLTVRTGLFLALTMLILVNSDTANAQSGSSVVVGQGDTLSQIAENYGTDTSTLMRLNNLSSDNHIRLGQVLVMPGANAAASASSGEWQTYVVKQGDSLSVLARDYRVGLARLAEINLISPSQNLYIGQALKLPINSLRTISVQPVPITGSEASDSGAEAGANLPAVHTVQGGEHLGTIARRYGTTSTAIAQANYLTNASHIVPGQRLTIPSATASSDASIINTDAYSHFPTTTEKWIDVDLTRQLVTAYDGITPLASFLVSTGKAETPTVQGTFRIWATTPIQDMFALSRAGSSDVIENVSDRGPQYEFYTEDVEWVQYFHHDYAFHAAYWHNSFGKPVSRGCVNMRPDDAKWLFEWASPQVSRSSWTFLSGYNRGTLVKVHQ